MYNERRLINILLHNYKFLLTKNICIKPSFINIILSSFKTSKHSQLFNDTVSVVGNQLAFCAPYRGSDSRSELIFVWPTSVNTHTFRPGTIYNYLMCDCDIYIYKLYL